MPGQMECFGASDIGQQRTSNEDQFLIADLSKSLRVHHTSLALDHQTRLFGNSQGKLLLVADGMGGHEAGERASTLAVDGIATYTLNTLRWFFRLDEQDDDDLADDLKAAIEHCQEVLQREAEALPQRRGMGTTLTMAYVIWPRLYVVHVGDSRCYLSRDGQLKQLTRDHTLGELCRDAATQDLDTSSDADDTRLSHVLWNVIGGGDQRLMPEVHRATLKVGDRLLLCTDGLTRHVPDEQISQLMASDVPAEQLCQRFIALANDDGGSDNVTVVVAQFRGPAELVSGGMSAEIPATAEASRLADTGPFPVKSAIVE